MKIDLTPLEEISTISKQLQKISLKLDSSIDKRWLTSKELAIYLDYSLDGINKMIKEHTFICNYHYYKPSGKLLFSKVAIDNWVVGINNNIDDTQYTLNIDELIKSLK